MGGGGGGGGGQAGAARQPLWLSREVHTLAFSEPFRGIWVSRSTLCRSGVLGSQEGVVIKPNGAFSQEISVALFSLRNLESRGYLQISP